MHGNAHDSHDASLSDQTSHESDAERQQRERALRGLLDSGTGSGISTSRQNSPLGSQSRFSRRLAALASALALVLAIIVVLVHVLSGTSNTPSGAKAIQRTFLDPSANGLDCPHDVSWSTDGALVAVVGYASDCPTTSGPYVVTTAQGAGLSHVVGLVNIYDAKTGRIVAKLSPDAQITKTIVVPQAVITYEQSQAESHGLNISLYDVNYRHILWSSDRTRIAVTFTAFVPTDVPTQDATTGQPVWPGLFAEGVETMTVPAGPVQVFIHPVSGTTASFLEWDLQSGALVAPAPSLMPSGPQYTVTPAQAYQWGSGGTLTPIGSLSATSSASTSPSVVSSPDGQASFSLWQPGIASPDVTTWKGSDPGVFNWTTDIAAWSPDSRYLVEGIEIAGVVTGPGIVAADSSSLASVGWSTAPQIPARDAALTQVASIARAHSFHAIVTERTTVGVTPTGVLLAWRPSGKTLAVDAASSDGHVQLLDTVTGKRTVALQPLANPHFVHGPAEQNEANILRWSPDGSRLLLLDPTQETITIWNVAGSVG